MGIAILYIRFKSGVIVNDRFRNNNPSILPIARIGQIMGIEPNNKQMLSEDRLLLQRIAGGEINAFWILWQRHQDYLLRCCLRRTNGNLTEAEDLLSQAMLKAREKLQDYAKKIANVKAWLGKLINNLWLDLARRRDGKQVEDIEAYAAGEELGLVSVGDTPASALEHEEKKNAIAGAIDNLKPRMRETFILHFYQQLSHQEIAEKQEISYNNVCKRISQARTILAEELRGYFLGEPGTKPDTAKVAAKPAKSRKAEKKSDRVEPILPETPKLSERVEDEQLSHQEMHQEMGERQEISCQNVCKQIFQAREVLQEESPGYLLGENGTKTEVSATPAVTKSAKEEISEESRRAGEVICCETAEGSAIPAAQVGFSGGNYWGWVIGIELYWKTDIRGSPPVAALKNNNIWP
ncbi:MAG: sigma-70 family RNA polymerase sigma factor [Oscillatoria sp. SIO1A7]|nr:sigma-70 family RNA polymerase sigma factor [Oscillatoria sp. SIO1A7]